MQGSVLALQRVKRQRVNLCSIESDLNRQLAVEAAPEQLRVRVSDEVVQGFWMSSGQLTLHPMS